MTELEEAELTDGQGRALSAHKSQQAYEGYAKRTLKRALAATRKPHAHTLAAEIPQRQGAIHSAWRRRKRSDQEIWPRQRKPAAPRRDGRIYGQRRRRARLELRRRAGLYQVTSLRNPRYRD